MEIDYRLTRAQEGGIALFAVAAADRSWVLQRLQGTGVRFWRIVWCAHPDWRGDLYSADGKTLSEVIDSALIQFRAHKAQAAAVAGSEGQLRTHTSVG